MRKVNIIILGSTSFIGKKLLSNLKKKYQVLGFGSKQIDLTKKKELSKLNKYINPDSIILVLSANKLQKGASIKILDQNYKMYSNLFSLLEKNIPKKIIFFSSQVVFGEYVNNNNTKENTKQIPNTYYGLSKIIGEKLLELKFKGNKKKYTIMRLPRIYGPDDSVDNYGPTQFVYNFLQRKQIKVWGDGKERREFIHISDVVKITELLFNSKIYGPINICSGQSYRFIDIIKIIKKITGKKVNYFNANRTGDSVNHILNNSYFNKKFPNYKFKNLHTGIIELLRDKKFIVK